MKKHTMVITTKNGVEIYGRLYQNYKKCDDALIRVSFNLNALRAYAEQHNIRYNVVTIEKQ